MEQGSEAKLICLRMWKKMQYGACRACQYREPVKLTALEQAIKILAEDSDAEAAVMDRTEFEFDIVTAVSRANTQEALSEEGKMSLKCCSMVISPGAVIFGSKDRRNGWYSGPDGRDVIDLRNADSRRNGDNLIRKRQGNIISLRPAK